MWRHYFQNTKAILFAVDSNDRKQLSNAAEELQQILEKDELQNIPVLVLVNKSDMPNAMPVGEIVDKLGFHNVRGQKKVKDTCLDGAGRS